MYGRTGRRPSGSGRNERRDLVGKASAGALDALASAVEAGAARGRPVGAGTVITVEQVRQAARAGAAFTVSPGFDREV
ncbi:hypothetical protein NKH18_18785 [Streptomyces sp. M10(2022)]